MINIDFVLQLILYLYILPKFLVWTFTGYFGYPFQKLSKDSDKT